MAKKKYTPKAFAEAVEKYFRSISYLRTAEDESGCPIRNSDGEIISYMDFAVPPSITDLCIRLGICKDTFDAYMRDEHYAEICQRAKMLIENWLVRQLNTREKSVDGIKFNLTYNFGWSGEKREVELGEATRDAVSAANIPMKDKLALINAVIGEISSSGSGSENEPNAEKLSDGSDGVSDETAVNTRPDDSDADRRADASVSPSPDVHSLGGKGYYDDEDSPHGAVDHSERV